MWQWQKFTIEKQKSLIPFILFKLEFWKVHKLARIFEKVVQVWLASILTLKDPTDVFEKEDFWKWKEVQKFWLGFSTSCLVSQESTLIISDSSSHWRLPTVLLGICAQSILLLSLNWAWGVYAQNHTKCLITLFKKGFFSNSYLQVFSLSKNLLFYN